MQTTIELIEEKMAEFGLLNINENTTVFVNKEDVSDVEVADSEFNTFAKAHAACASYFVDFNGDDATINIQAIEGFVNNEVEA